jgi:uncharacterized circularly permuted ATP-grasp superfamily protein
VPLIIDEDDWVGISRGLTQRAELLEKIVADIYGDNTWWSAACCRPN